MALNVAPIKSYNPAAVKNPNAGQIAAIDQQITELEKQARTDPTSYAMTKIRELSDKRNQMAMSGQPDTSVDTAQQQVDQNNQTWRDATLGQGDAMMSDPYLQTSLDTLGKVASGKDTTYYTQASDMNAEAAGQQAQQLRQQGAAAGIGGGDPAMQAQMRSLDTNRLLSNNGALATQNNMAQDAAGRLAQMRLQQTQAANQMYQQGAQMAYNQNIPRGNTGVGAQTATRPYQQHAGPTATNPTGNWAAPETNPGAMPAPAPANPSGQDAQNQIGVTEQTAMQKLKKNNPVGYTSQLANDWGAGNEGDWGGNAPMSAAQRKVKADLADDWGAGNEGDWGGGYNA